MIKRAMINRRHNLHLLTVEGSQRHHRVLVVVVDRAWLPVPGVVTRHVTRGAQHGHTLHAADGAGARHEEGAHVSQLGRGGRPSPWLLASLDAVQVSASPPTTHAFASGLPYTTRMHATADPTSDASP